MGGFITYMDSKLARMIRETWFFWLFFICLGFRVGRETETAQVSPRAEFAVSIAFALLVVFWIVRDARRRERKLGYGFPALVLLLWPLFAPIYLFQTRGMRGFLSLLAFLAMFVAATALGAGIGALTDG